MSRPSNSHYPGDIIIASTGTAFDQALAALVEKCGYSAQLASPEALAHQSPRVVIFSDAAQLQQVTASLRCAGRVALVGLHSSENSRSRSCIRPVTWLSGRETVSSLGRILHDAVGPSAHGIATRVRVSFREREVLATYVLGATVESTATTHHIAISTVKTHYRRVADRYTNANRPVANKSQLLIELVADGWIEPRIRVAS